MVRRRQVNMRHFLRAAGPIICLNNSIGFQLKCNLPGGGGKNGVWLGSFLPSAFSLAVAIFLGTISN